MAGLASYSTYLMKYPEYHGWSYYMLKKPGETSYEWTTRIMVWDSVVEGEIVFKNVEIGRTL